MPNEAGPARPGHAGLAGLGQPGWGRAARPEWATQTGPPDWAARPILKKTRKSTDDRIIKIIKN